jgi:hypothetical protein
MAQPGVKVEGLKLLNRNLKKLSTDYPKELKSIHQKVSEPVAVLASRKVRSRTGRLAASIKAGATLKGGHIQAGKMSVPYAAVNHWGGYPGDYQGNPFLTDALEELEDNIVNEWENLTHTFIERIWIDS